MCAVQPHLLNMNLRCRRLCRFGAVVKVNVVVACCKSPIYFRFFASRIVCESSRVLLHTTISASAIFSATSSYFKRPNDSTSPNRLSTSAFTISSRTVCASVKTISSYHLVFTDYSIYRKFFPCNPNRNFV